MTPEGYRFHSRVDDGTVASGNESNIGEDT